MATPASLSHSHQTCPVMTGVLFYDSERVALVISSPDPYLASLAPDLPVHLNLPCWVVWLRMRQPYVSLPEGWRVCPMSRLVRHRTHISPHLLAQRITPQSQHHIFSYTGTSLLTSIDLANSRSCRIGFENGGPVCLTKLNTLAALPSQAWTLMGFASTKHCR